MWKIILLSTTILLHFGATLNITVQNGTTQTTYQVTENVIDIADNRTLAPIVPNYTIFTPINIAVNNNNKPFITPTLPTNGQIDNQSGTTEVDSEGGDKEDNKEKPNIKKNSFSILHIKGEFDNDKVENQNGGIKKIFGGVKDYIYTMKKGLVDGLHDWFHRGDNYHPYYRSFKNEKHDHFSHHDYDSDEDHDCYDDEEDDYGY